MNEMSNIIWFIGCFWGFVWAIIGIMAGRKKGFGMAILSALLLVGIFSFLGWLLLIFIGWLVKG